VHAACRDDEEAAMEDSVTLRRREEVRWRLPGREAVLAAKRDWRREGGEEGC
jgi:hypothetical protein